MAIREHLVTNPSQIGTAIRDINTENGIASGDALNAETASMPHSLGKDDTEDSAHIRHDAHEIAEARKRHAAERFVASAQPEHPDAPPAVDRLTGGASPSAGDGLARPGLAVTSGATIGDAEAPLDDRVPPAGAPLASGEAVGQGREDLSV